MYPLGAIKVLYIVITLAYSDIHKQEKNLQIDSNQQNNRSEFVGKCKTLWKGAHESLRNFSHYKPMDIAGSRAVRETYKSTSHSNEGASISYSWLTHVGYYRWGCTSQVCDHSEVEWICSAALIGPRHVITVAQCFADLEGQTFVVKIHATSKKYSINSLNIHPSQTLAIIILTHSPADHPSVNPISLLVTKNIEELTGHRIKEVFFRMNNQYSASYSQFFTEVTTVIEKPVCRALIECARSTMDTTVAVPRTILCGIPDSIQLSSCSVLSGGAVFIEYNRKPLLVGMKMSDPLCLFVTNVYFPFYRYRTWILSYLKFFQTSTGF